MKPPLVLRQTDPIIQAIARAVTRYGIHEDDFYALTRELAQTHGGERVSDAMLELTWTEKDKRWVRLRPETLRALRPFIGPKSDDPEWERWWTGQGKTPPEPRTPETWRQKREEKPKAEEKPAKKTRARKKTG